MVLRSSRVSPAEEGEGVSSRLLCLERNELSGCQRRACLFQATNPSREGRVQGESLFNIYSLSALQPTTPPNPFPSLLPVFPPAGTSSKPSPPTNPPPPPSLLQSRTNPPPPPTLEPPHPPPLQALTLTLPLPRLAPTLEDKQPSIQTRTLSPSCPNPPSPYPNQLLRHPLQEEQELTALRVMRSE